MKKILSIVMVLLLALALLTACGGDNGGDATDNEGSGNEQTSTADSDKKIIKPSEIITLEDATEIFGMDMKVFEDLDAVEGEEPFRSYKTIYEFDGKTDYTPYMIQITTSPDVAFTVDEAKKEYADYKDTWVEGIGDFAMITTDNLHNMSVYYKDYSFSMVLTGNMGTRSEEEDSAWKVEKLKELGKRGVENIDALLQ